MAVDDAAAPEGGVAAEASSEEMPNLGTVPTGEPEQDQVAAATAEVGTNGHRVTYLVREGDEDPLELVLPPKLLLSVIGRSSTVRQDDVEEIFQLIEAVVGREQYVLVMNQLDKHGVTTDDEEAASSLGRLLNDALTKYGTSSGESQASPDS